MEIRRATAADAGTISALNKAVQALHAAAQPHLFKPPADSTFSGAAVTELLADPDVYMFLGYVDDIPVGYLYAQIRRRPETPFRYALSYLLIHQITIESAYQRQGYGARLLQEALAIARAQGLTRVELDVWSFNEAARAFYLSQGFQVYHEQMCIEL